METLDNMKVAIVSALVAVWLISGYSADSFGRPAVAAAQEVGIGDPKIEYRLRVARADAQQEKMHDAADEIGQLSSKIAERVSRGEALRAEDGKILDRIKRLAKRLRSDLGGGGEPTLEERPATMNDAARTLGASGAEFAKLFSGSTRYVVDARIIRKAGEIVLLTDLLKPYAR